ncbi:MAG: TatD family hydrolase [Cyclobacteriaceae bacterium]
MQLIDSHAHIYSDKFKEDIDEVISKSLEAGVSGIYMPNIDHESIDAMLELEARYPANCFSMMGLHPCSVQKGFEKHLYEVEEWLNRRPFSAVGEIGTDLYWDKSLFEYQKEAFTIQCDLAIKHELPVAIHCRESIDETIELLENPQYEQLTGVFHCFTGTAEQANRIIELGFKLGIGGVLTFKNSGLADEIKDIGNEHFLLETDSPYLAPTPYRGKRNTPEHIPLIAQKLADIKACAVREIAEITTDNSIKLFRNYEL